MYVVVTQKSNINTKVFVKSSCNLKVTLSGGVRTVVTHKDNIRTQYSVYNMMEIKEYTRRAEEAADSAEDTLLEVIAAGQIQIARIIAEGNYQDNRVIEEGDTQEARVIAEGDTQVARVILAADTIVADAQEQAWIAEAEAMTSDSYANEFVDGTGGPAEWVKDYYSNNDGTFGFTSVFNTYSSYYWSTKSQLGSEGLNFVDVWDMSGGVYPTTRPPEGAGDPLAIGDYFIVTVAGTTPDLIDWLIGDFAIVTSAAPLEWGRYPNVLDWNAIVNVPENVYNALSRSGGTMTGNIILNNNIKLLSKLLDTTEIEILSVLSTDEMSLNPQALDLKIGGWVNFLTTAPTTNHQPVDPADLTRKDYIDNNFLPLVGGTVTGQIKGITPIAPADLTTKDYVDNRIHLLDGAAVGIEFTVYGQRDIPGFAVALDGLYYSKTIFSELYAILGDDWNTAFGQEEPPADYFRVPVSQDLLLFTLDEDGNSDMGTYHYNNAIGRPSPIKCMWSSYRVERKKFINDNFELYGSHVSGFTRTMVYENLDFEINTVYNVGFGDERLFSNDGFQALASYIDGFATRLRIGNTDFPIHADYINGFGTYGKFTNDDFATYVESASGFGSSSQFSNIDFPLTSVYMNGFTVLLRLSNSNFAVNVVTTTGFSTLVLFSNSNFSVNVATNDGFVF